MDYRDKIKAWNWRLICWVSGYILVCWYLLYLGSRAVDLAGGEFLAGLAALPYILLLFVLTFPASSLIFILLGLMIDLNLGFFDGVPMFVLFLLPPINGLILLWLRKWYLARKGHRISRIK